MALLENLIKSNESNLGRALTDEEKAQLGTIVERSGDQIEDQISARQKNEAQIAQTGKGVPVKQFIKNLKEEAPAGGGISKELKGESKFSSDANRPELAAERVVGNIPLMGMMSGEVRNQLQAKGGDISPERSVALTVNALRGFKDSNSPLDANNIIQKAVKSFTVDPEIAKANKLEKKNKALLEGKIADSVSTLSNATEIARNFDLDAFTLQGRASEKISGFLDSLNLASTSDKQLIEGRRAQKQKIEVIFQQYRKMITGAQASVAELEQLKKATLNNDLSPSQAKSSLRDLMVNLIRDQKAVSNLLTQGIDLKKLAGEDADSALISERVKVMNESRDDIEKEIVGIFPGLASEEDNQELLDALRRKRGL